MAKSRIRKFRESFLYAGRGLRLCITGERNFRVHMTAAFYVTAAAVMGHVTSTEAAVLCLCFGLTMGAELMNTAVERLCDKTARGYDRMVRDAKDIAAAAVFVCAAACVAVGVCIFLMHGAAGGRSAVFSRAALARDGLSLSPFRRPCGSFSSSEGSSNCPKRGQASFLPSPQQRGRPSAVPAACRRRRSPF